MTRTRRPAGFAAVFEISALSALSIGSAGLWPSVLCGGMDERNLTAAR